MSGRVLEVPGTDAVVELGGVPIAAGEYTAVGRVLRADRPSRPDARDSEEATAQALRRAGVSIVIDLRTATERAKVPPHLFGATSVRQYNIPVGGDPGAGHSTPEALSDLYQEMVRTSGPAFVAILETIARHCDETVLLHCRGGRDRTGMAAALLLLVAGVRVPDVLREQATVGCLVSAEVRRRRQRWIDKGRDQARFDRANSGEVLALARALRTIARDYGGTGDYLTAHGMTADALETVTTVLHRC